MGILRRSRKASGGSSSTKALPGVGVSSARPDPKAWPAQPGIEAEPTPLDAAGDAYSGLPAPGVCPDRSASYEPSPGSPPADPALGAAADVPLFAEPVVSDRERRRERRLVEAACQGDRSAIEALYRTYYDPIYRYVLLRLGSVAAAEDVTSQVFLGMLQGLRRYRDEGRPFLAWLYAIAQKQVAFYLRRENRTRDAVDLDAVAELAADTAGPHATVEERELRSAIARALRRLPDGQREVVMLRYILGFSVAETAAVIGRTEGAVKQLQLRALAGLKSLLGLDRTEPERPKPGRSTSD